ncbi:hypothetical protein BSKO_13274 [Bryopsis sp. KO-2023]|nr:hypothetical protein BSKO_13274 [Bryopsis sp. KO-2023]
MHSCSRLPCRLAGSLHRARVPVGVSRCPGRPGHLASRFVREAVSGTPVAVDSDSFEWKYKDNDFTIPVDVVGQGDPVLLLPAISTVSTRGEVSQLVDKLKDSFQTVTLDWPGFGDATRQPMKYDGDIFYTFLADFVKQRFSGPVRVVACGHSASFAIKLAAESPDSFSHLSLVAPTWAGPFRIMGVNPTVRGLVASALRAPVVGTALFNSLSSEDNLVKQYKSHVFTGDSLLTDDFIATKQKVTSHPNARFGASSFVTGNLDVVEEREELLGWIKNAKANIQVVIGNEMPKRTAVEMNAMAEVEGVEVARAPGALGMHEEFGSEVAEAVLPFLMK